MQIIKTHKSFGGELQFCEHDSQVTHTSMKYSIYLPEQSQGIKLPVIFWLSGLTCTEENFMAKAGAQQWANRLGLILVAPDTSPRGLDLPGEHDSYDFGSGAGFYVNAVKDPWHKNYQMYDYIAHELFELVGENYSVDMSRVGISGHSMGGHGALVVGLKNPDKFKSISAFSPICAPSQCPWGQKAFAHYLGDDREAWATYDATELILADKVKTPLLIDQGTADEFLTDQLKTDILERACQERQHVVKINYREGYDHSYYFIATFIQEHLKYHAQQLS